MPRFSLYSVYTKQLGTDTRLCLERKVKLVNIYYSMIVLFLRQKRYIFLYFELCSFSLLGIEIIKSILQWQPTMCVLTCGCNRFNFTTDFFPFFT